MEKTSRLLLSLLVLSGGILNACAPKDQAPEEEVIPEFVDGSFGGETIAPEETAAPEEQPAGSTPAVRPPADKPAEEAKPVEEPAASAPLSLYMDGTYQQNGTYNSPAGVDTVGVSLTIKDDVVTAVNVSVLATNEGSIYFQQLFADGIASFVVGKPLEDLTGVSVVNGSSLTPTGFNQALVAIKAEALR